jgi:hypothetical protein
MSDLDIRLCRLRHVRVNEPSAFGVSRQYRNILVTLASALKAE